MSSDSLTILLGAAKAGDKEAWASAVAIIYPELRRLAQRNLRGSPNDQTLGATALVHECYLRLFKSASGAPVCRAHFMNLASRVMRQVICDYARERLSQKRGSGRKRADDDVLDDQADSQVEAATLIDVDEALAILEKDEPDWARVFECRFFAGLSPQETAEALDVPLRSVQRYWEQSRAWLASRLRA